MTQAEPTAPPRSPRKPKRWMKRIGDWQWARQESLSGVH